VARHALGQLEVEADAQVLATGRQRMSGGLVDLGESLHPLGHPAPALEPRVLRDHVAVERLLGGGFVQSATRLVDLGDLAAAIERGHDGQAPGVVVREVLVHGGKLLSVVCGSGFTYCGVTSARRRRS
jgi:hypothetical protein